MRAASLLVLGLLAGVSLGAKELTLDNLTLGKTVVGPNLSLPDLKGKVVFVEFWGTR